MKQITAIFAALSAAFGSAYASSIVNGGFEAEPLNPGEFIRVFNMGEGFDGWTVTDGSVEIVRSGFIFQSVSYTATEGEFFVNVSGLSAGEITQTLTGLSVGSTYELTLDAIPIQGFGDVEKPLIITAGATSETFTLNRLTQNDWEPLSFTFIATSAMMDLSLASTEDNIAGVAIDNLRLSTVMTTPVPVPAAALLFAPALIALRRRKAS